jgi:hypothetical protein
MSLHDKLKRLDGLQGRLLEDELYRIVGEEIEAGVKDTAAWVRAVADGAGDDAATKSMYIKHRVRRLQDEISLSAAEAELQKAQQADLRLVKQQEKEMIKRQDIRNGTKAGLKLVALVVIIIAGAFIFADYP